MALEEVENECRSTGSCSFTKSDKWRKTGLDPVATLTSQTYTEYARSKSLCLVKFKINYLMQIAGRWINVYSINSFGAFVPFERHTVHGIKTIGNSHKNVLRESRRKEFIAGSKNYFTVSTVSEICQTAISSLNESFINTNCTTLYTSLLLNISTSNSPVWRACCKWNENW